MEYNHKYFTDKRIEFKLGMGTGEFIENVFFVKCYGCFDSLEANEVNFTVQRESLIPHCKKCMKKKYEIWNINKALK